MKDSRKNLKVVVKIDTPSFKRGDVVDRFDLEIDRLVDYPDLFRVLNTEEKLHVEKLGWTRFDYVQPL